MDAVEAETKVVANVVTRNGCWMMIAMIALPIHSATGFAQSTAQATTRVSVQATAKSSEADGDGATARGVDHRDDGRPAIGAASQNEKRQPPLLDDIPKVRRRGASKEPEQTPGPGEAGRLGAESGEDLGAKKGSNPLRMIESNMRSVEKALRREDLAAGTQSKQREIAQQLAALIEQLERQRQSSSRSSGKSKSTAAEPEAAPSSTGQEVVRSETGTDRPSVGADGEGEKVPVGIAKEVWGQLPARVRQQMQNLKSEEFLPKYERMIQQYYKRLAEMDRATPGRESPR